MWRPAVKRRAQAAARSCIAEAAGLRFTIMAEVILKNVRKVYPNTESKKKKKKDEAVEKKNNLEITDEGVVAVQDFNIDVADKEFIVLVGPSGCGKSTTLRMIAGLEEISGGELFIDGKQMNDVAPKDRDIAMVFQNYALYPHMTVYENIAFPLKLKKIAETDADGKTHLKKMPNDEIDRRVREAAEILDITQFLDRKPKALSGGQRQRVAIGRAIVRSPKVLLMDEPLSNLDAKLRNQMRAEIIKLREKIDTTFVYVTHDQEEALTMSDTIVVMNQGYIQQIGTPEDIYNEPQNAFVADFIGDSNILDGIMIEDRLVEILGAKFECVDVGFGKNKPVDVVIRPEDIDLVKPEEGTIRGRVTHLIFKGVHYEMEVTVNGFELLVHSTDLFPVGQEVGIHVDPFDIQIMNKPESEDEEAVEIDA